jgi:anti-sigma factor RsiW
MNCRDFKGIMVEYCEESLPVATRESVETHLASCVRCRGRLAEWTRIERTLGQAMTAPYPSPGFSRRLRAALAATESARRPGAAAPVFCGAAQGGGRCGRHRAGVGCFGCATNERRPPRRGAAGGRRGGGRPDSASVRLRAAGDAADLCGGTRRSGPL